MCDNPKCKKCHKKESTDDCVEEIVVCKRGHRGHRGHTGAFVTPQIVNTGFYNFMGISGNNNVLYNLSGPLINLNSSNINAGQITGINKIGSGSLIGDSNSIGIGNGALNNATGINNIAIGLNAASNSTIGSGNIVIGVFAGQNLSGNLNVIIGTAQNISNNNNVVIGNCVLSGNIIDNSNVIIGHNCGNSLTEITNAVIIGSNTAQNATTPGGVIAIGYCMLSGNTIGDNNTCIALNAGNSLGDASRNVLIGPNSAQYLKTGNNNVIITAGRGGGDNYLGSESNNIILGFSNGMSGESNVCRIGTSGNTGCWIPSVILQQNVGVTINGNKLLTVFDLIPPIGGILLNTGSGTWTTPTGNDLTNFFKPSLTVNDTFETHFTNSAGSVILSGNTYVTVYTGISGVQSSSWKWQYNFVTSWTLYA